MEMFKYIIEFLRNIRLSDIIDTGIITVFIYSILVWFKKSRGRFMLLGIIIMAAIYVLAKFFGLYLTTIAFQTFFAVFLIMIIVIFQDDLRHFFERIAILGLRYKGVRRPPFSQSIEILTTSLANLSRKGIGALVVIRGRDPLERYLEAGIDLDGNLSQVLLESLFDPHVPSHDGAVILDGLKVKKFGCHLPLSTNIEEIGHLGTRHAAALGLAERTDSLCIVVSEERGVISVAEGERIRQLKDITELYKVLQDFYQKRFPERKRSAFREFLAGHFLEKVIALVFACGLWLAFGHRIEIIRRDFVIPIEYRNLSADRIIAEPKPREATITLSGTERAFDLLDPKDLKLSLDMSKIEDGENRVFLTKDLVRYPSRLSLFNIEPSQVQLKVFRMVEFYVPIELKIIGRPPVGVTVRDIRVEPEKIKVKASNLIPQDQITITTEPINLETLTETKIFSPKLIFSPDIRFPDDKIPEVRVTVEIEKKE
jgi:uncharacterized protein (TIGR00159 family)